MLGALKRLWEDESGQGMVEYGLLTALIAVVLVAAIIALRNGLQNTFQQVTDCVSDPRNSSACG